MPAITVENLKYKYPGTNSLVLEGVTFSVEKGEFVGIVGRNGVGKSTLSQAINGLVPQFYKGGYGGKVTINTSDGLSIDAASTPVSELSSYVGLIFQNPFNQLSGAKDTVFDEVAFGLQNLGVDKAEMSKRVEEVLKQLDIWQYRKRNPFDLSGGQMQRVAIASILVMKPEIIILDEPTSQLDPQGSEEVFGAVDKLSKMGITIIMIEQKLEKMAQYCDRLLLLHEGKVVDYNTPDVIFSREDIEEFGILPPVYTRISKKYDIKNEDGSYPSTLEKTKQLFKSAGISLADEDVWNTADVADVSDVAKTDAANDATADFALTQKRLEKVFTVSDMTFSYNEEAKIFENLSLELDYRPTAIIGQNGAGKTTLVRLLKGLLKPESGSILLQGEDISKKTVASLSSKVGYVFQNPDDQIFKNKVIDEIMFGPLNIGMNQQTAREHAMGAIKLMGLEGKENENPYDLDLYERKMVAIASVVAMDTEVIILDEPTIAQDYSGRKKIANMIMELSKKGKLVIAILHDMDFVADTFDRVIAMAHGRILLDGTAKEIFKAEDTLKEAKLQKPYALLLYDEMNSEK